MIALIDGDIVIHRVGFTTNDDEFKIAKWRADEMLDGIILDTSANEFHIYFSDLSDNDYRRHIYPEYKANRTQPKPKHYDALKEYLITSPDWQATIAVEMEADDALGINQDKVKGTTVICSIDKDLMQIPGSHYNFVKKEWREVSVIDGRKKFYHQLLTGDTSDNVHGIRGIGDVKAGRILSGLYSDTELFLACIRAYEKWLRREWDSPLLSDFQYKQMYDIMLLNGRVLKIKQNKDEGLWQFPKEYTRLQPTLAGE